MIDSRAGTSFQRGVHPSVGFAVLSALWVIYLIHRHRVYMGYAGDGSDHCSFGQDAQLIAGFVLLHFAFGAFFFALSKAAGISHAKTRAKGVVILATVVSYLGWLKIYLDRVSCYIDEMASLEVTVSGLEAMEATLILATINQFVLLHYFVKYTDRIE